MDLKLRILFSTIPLNISILNRLQFLLSLRIILQQCIQSLLWTLNYTVVAELDAQCALDLSGDGGGGWWDHPGKNLFNTSGPDKKPVE